MFAGVVFGLVACFLWGFIFVVPEWMTGFSAIEVAMGRYLVYGTISAILFIKTFFHKKINYPKDIWIKALYFSFISTFFYYTFLVLSLRYASPAIAALILGISPIAIAFYGNFRQKETSYKSLILPSCLILLGLIIINVPHFETTSSPGTYLLGLLFSAVALCAWSWYVVANARFMKQHPHILANDWSTLIGLATLFWVLIIGIILSIFFENQLDMKKYLTWNEAQMHFWIGSLILGLFSSWIGAFLWNKASFHLPVSLAGQLTVFETIFGVIFVYLVTQSWPSWMEAIGMAILLFAVIHGIRHFSKKYAKQITPH